MSTKYTGGFITKSPVAPTSSAASGIWTLDQQQQAQKAGTWPSPPIFIEDLFSTYLYTGNSSTQTITNNIDLSTKGGLTWIKSRSDTTSHFLFDTIRGALNEINSNNTQAQASLADSLTAFNTNGFSLGNSGQTNFTGETYASWTFREQPKFFDVVTWTGNGTGDREISHNLGVAPGCIIFKSTSNAGTNWFVYHRALSTPDYRYMYLQDTAAALTSGDNLWNVTSTTFRASSTLDANNNGFTYVAYLFAHDAGGFPVSGGGSTNGISCGSFTTDGSGNATVTLGYEPQWVLNKTSSSADNWTIADNMRGFSVTNEQRLYANLSNAEAAATTFRPTATGYTVNSGEVSKTYIYIAIRRGPMKTPTVGTSVYNAIARAGTGAVATVTGVGFPPDLLISKIRTSTVGANWSDRLRGSTANLISSSDGAEAISANRVTALGQDGFSLGTASEVNASGFDYINWNFRRAPSFFDEVCDTGTGSTHTIAHNLGVVPEFMIRKSRSQSSTAWYCYVASEGASRRGFLNQDFAWGGPDNSIWGGTTPTSTVFTVGADGSINNNASTYVTYLFATCAGVSKVGTYTGTGALQTVNCGFTSGARFVLIKRTDSTGDWYVYDSARGITSGNDPYLLLNSTAAEVTGTNYVDTDTTGFKVTAAAPAGLNANGGTYIFLAIA